MDPNTGMNAGARRRPSGRGISCRSDEICFRVPKPASRCRRRAARQGRRNVASNRPEEPLRQQSGLKVSGPDPLSRTRPKLRSPFYVISSASPLPQPGRNRAAGRRWRCFRRVPPQTRARTLRRNFAQAGPKSQAFCFRRSKFAACISGRRHRMGALLARGLQMSVYPVPRQEGLSRAFAAT